MTSNIAQNFPYSSESEAERAAAVAKVASAYAGLADKLKAEATALGEDPRWWVWKCPSPGCAGLLHAAGFARNAHAVYTVCDTCGKTYQR